MTDSIHTFNLSDYYFFTKDGVLNVTAKKRKYLSDQEFEKIYLSKLNNLTKSNIIKCDIRDDLIIISQGKTKYICFVCLNDKPAPLLVKCVKCVCITCLDCKNIILGDFYEYHSVSMNAPKCPLCRRVIVPDLNMYANNATIDDIEPTGAQGYGFNANRH